MFSFERRDYMKGGENMIHISIGYLSPKEEAYALHILQKTLNTTMYEAGCKQVCSACGYKRVCNDMTNAINYAKLQYEEKCKKKGIEPCYDITTVLKTRKT